MIAYFFYNAYHFVARDQRKSGHAKIITNKMEIGITDAAIFYFYENVMRSGYPSCEIPENQRFCGGHCGIPFCGKPHGCQAGCGRFFDLGHKIYVDG